MAAVSVWPAWAVPPMVGAPVAAHCWGVRSQRAGCRTGHRLLVVPVVGEAHPHLDRLAHVVVSQRVGGGRGVLYFGIVGGATGTLKLALSSPSASAMPDVDAVSVWPACTVPLIVGVPVAALFVESRRRTAPSLSACWSATPGCPRRR